MYCINSLVHSASPDSKGLSRLLSANIWQQAAFFFSSSSFLISPSAAPRDPDHIRCTYFTCTEKCQACFREVIVCNMVGWIACWLKGRRSRVRAGRQGGVSSQKAHRPQRPRPPVNLFFISFSSGVRSVATALLLCWACGSGRTGVDKQEALRSSSATSSTTVHLHLALQLRLRLRL